MSREDEAYSRAFPTLLVLGLEDPTQVFELRLGWEATTDRPRRVFAAADLHRLLEAFHDNERSWMGAYERGNKMEKLTSGIHTPDWRTANYTNVQRGSKKIKGVTLAALLLVLRKYGVHDTILDSLIDTVHASPAYAAPPPHSTLPTAGGVITGGASIGALGNGATAPVAPAARGAAPRTTSRASSARSSSAGGGGGDARPATGGAQGTPTTRAKRRREQRRRAAERGAREGNEDGCVGSAGGAGASGAGSEGGEGREDGEGGESGASGAGGGGGEDAEVGDVTALSPQRVRFSASTSEASPSASEASPAPKRAHVGPSPRTAAAAAAAEGDDDDEQLAPVATRRLERMLDDAQEDAGEAATENSTRDAEMVSPDGASFNAAAGVGGGDDDGAFNAAAGVGGGDDDGGSRAGRARRVTLESSQRDRAERDARAAVREAVHSAAVLRDEQR